MPPWRRPPTCYDEDEEANADSYFLFTLLDRDQSAYLDLKEVVQARALLVEALAGDEELRDKLAPVSGMLDSCDSNNDAKVKEGEWHDFVRAVYEIAGRNRFRTLISSWRKALVAKINAELAEQAQKDKAKKAKGGGGGSKAPPRSSVHANTVGLGKVCTDAAATKIQANIRGFQARRKAKTAGSRLDTVGGSRRAGIHESEKVKRAREVGRHLVTVVSQAGDGARADFYLDGTEIEFTREHGDLGSGLQVVVVDPEECTVTSRRCYEVFAPKTKPECARLVEDLASVPHGHFVLVANKSHGLRDLSHPAVTALRGVGSTFDGLGKREESYALIGCKGCRASEERSAKGFAMAEAIVSFQPEHRAEIVRRAATQDPAGASV